jgi:hypothetical protein
MTMVKGVTIVATPCCGAQYAAPRYLSMNFSASEYWTDGWRHESLMPNDEGLRRCACGRLLMLKDIVAIETAEASDLPRLKQPSDESLPECIAQTDRDDIEVAARLMYWRYLNHPYREAYRRHRNAEETSIRAAWEADNPDTRTWLEKLRGRKALSYTRPPGSPFTYPAFNATDLQLQNMLRLSQLLLDWGQMYERPYTLVLAELYREQGRFEEAKRVIETLGDDQAGVTRDLITRLIRERQTAPIRYMI